MSQILESDLCSIISGNPEDLDVHLELVERDVTLEKCGARVHCHCLTVDGNGRVRPERLAEFMRNAIVDYAIPKSKMDIARARDAKYKSGSATTELHQRAIGTFTHLKNTGEGGEMLLYLLAERFLKIPQVLCKMDLKTDRAVHYHGADGVYASVTEDSILKLFWGESKIYANPTDAIRDCLASLAPFLVESEHEDADRERDLLLLSDKADLSDPKLTTAFKKYFDRTLRLSNKVQYCGIALIGFDADFYPSDSSRAVADEIISSARSQMTKWMKNVRKRIIEEKLESFDIQFFCVPLPSADGFRGAFLKALGIEQ